MKLPWEKDPNDREANYRRPIPRIETVRSAGKFVFVGVAGAWLWWSTADSCRLNDVHDICRTQGSGAGSKLLGAIGFVLLASGATDLLYLRRHEIELIFARNKQQQIASRIGLVVAGLFALGAAVSGLS